MKNKRNTYLLICALLGIWGVVGFKMISSFKTEDTIALNTFVPNKQLKETAIDSFTIMANYDDPFRVKSYSRKKVITTNKPIVKKAPSKPKEKKLIKPLVKVTAKHMKYHGTIKNSNTSKIVGVLFINDQEVLVSIGTEIIDGKIISIQDDKISLLYKEKQFELEKE